MPPVHAAWRPNATVTFQVRGDAAGKLSLRATSVGRPFLFDPSALRFTWQAYDSEGRPTRTTYPASGIHIGTWSVLNEYPKWMKTPPDKPLMREYEATLGLGQSPNGPGLYRLTVSSINPTFAKTDLGEAIPLQDNSFVAYVYWPDEGNDDAATADLRRRVLGKTVYAFGGSMVGCYGSGTGYPPTAPLTITRVMRHTGVTYELDTGTTAHGASNFAFFAVDPIEVKIITTSHAVMNSGSDDAEQPCDPGLRFADPWQAGVTITSATPPPEIRPGARIAPGTSRRTVLWLLGYSDQFATAQYFNALDDWEYSGPSFRAMSVEFRNNAVTVFHSPTPLP